MHYSQHTIVTFSCILLLTGVSMAAEKRAKFEPPDGRVLHGWGQHTIRYEKEALPYIMAANHDCAIISVYFDLALVNGATPEIIDLVEETRPEFIERFNGDRKRIAAFIEEHFPSPSQFASFRQRTRKNYIPLIAVSWHGLNDKDIAEGKHDKEITQLADQVKACNFPVFVRPGSEVGPYGYNESRHQTSREHFAKMFRHFVDIFRERQVDNAAFVWCTVGVESYDYWMDYYAGDDYVDWWGINYFRKTQIIGSKAYLEEAEKRNKPVMICESAPALPISNKGTASAKSIDDFFIPYFDMLDANTHIKAFVYINVEWSAEAGSPFAHWPDSRIQSNAKVADFYRSALSDRKFVHLDDIQKPEDLRKLLGFEQMSVRESTNAK